MSNYLFSSESVSEGHPDKIADQISDTILDAIIDQDSHARVACETLVKSNLILIAGELTANHMLTQKDIESLVRQTVADIGYDCEALVFNAKTCDINNLMNKQSADIAQGVDREDNSMGAGDQGFVFGYACNETAEFMPAPISYAHRLMRKQAQLRKNKTIPWLRPDAKSQVTFYYEHGKPVTVKTVVLSTQHDPDISDDTIKETVQEAIIKAVIPAELLTEQTKYLINPTGRFVEGGPVSDCGLTGRKIIVDTYGGTARHGGGAFSGKDPTKVDRSAAYMARYAAKNVVASGLAEQCEIQIAYAIGRVEPVSIFINTHGTGTLSDECITQIVEKNIDFSPKGIIDHLDLLRPIYRQTATYGHFGRSDLDLPWEKTDLIETFQKG